MILCFSFAPLLYLLTEFLNTLYPASTSRRGGCMADYGVHPRLVASARTKSLPVRPCEKHRDPDISGKSRDRKVMLPLLIPACFSQLADTGSRRTIHVRSASYQHIPPDLKWWMFAKMSAPSSCARARSALPYLLKVCGTLCASGPFSIKACQRFLKKRSILS